MPGNHGKASLSRDSFLYFKQILHLCIFPQSEPGSYCIEPDAKSYCWFCAHQTNSQSFASPISYEEGVA
jgi:hypothetical protein